MKKQPKCHNKINGKKVKTASNPDSFLSKNPSWRFSQCDTSHEKWKISANEIDTYIFDKLQSFEKMTWSDVISASGGKSVGTNNHYIKVEHLSNEAQNRLEELKIFEDDLFSLRLNNTIRLFGILEDGVFRVLWRDYNHEVCKSNKKHT